MTNEQKIREAIRRFVKRSYAQVFPATVVEVNEEKQTCTVKMTENDLELGDVRLRASIDGEKDGVLIVPGAGSAVLVGVINEDLEQLFVCGFSKVDKVVLYDGSYGGLCKTPTLKEELEKTNDLLQGLIDVIAGTPVPEPGNGSPSALQSALSGAIAGKSLGDYSDIENQKMVHGE